jgi:hypothetical protein
MRATQFIQETTIPGILYHATYRPLLKSIRKNGLGGSGAKRNYEDSRSGVVYLATTPDIAESYAETSDIVPEDWLDEIVILTVNTAAIDRNKLFVDQNVLDNKGDTFEYHGIIPANEFLINESPMPGDWEADHARLGKGTTLNSRHMQKDLFPDEFEIKKMKKTENEIPNAIDGKPTRNSLGKLIHPTEEGIRNFWKWFGNSKVVDAQGRPLVVYHGTNVRPTRDGAMMGDITEFDRLFTTKFRAHSLDTVGSWFSTNPGEGGADMYAGGRQTPGAVIYPAHLSIQNPHITTFQLLQRRARLLVNGKDDGRGIGKAEVDALRKWLKDINKDGIKIEGSGNEGSTEFDNQFAWIALEPNQIKSATGNNGNFSSSSKIITEVPLPPDWDEEQMKKQKGTTFKSRVAYAISKSKKIGMGSSRVVVKLEEGGKPTALKIAKNRKGEAQNQAEIDLLSDGYISQMEIVIPIVDWDKSDPPVWLQTELARVPKSSKEICDYLGCKSLSSLLEFANGYKHSTLGYSIQQQILKTIEPQKEETFLYYAQSLAELVDFNVNLVDFMQYQNWGFYHGKPVIIDIGFTKEVAKLYGQ